MRCEILDIKCLIKKTYINPKTVTEKTVRENSPVVIIAERGIKVAKK